MTPEEQAQLVALYRQWNEVQGNLKQAEQINQLAVIPAVNELRYAGRILVHVLASGQCGVDLAGEAAVDLAAEAAERGVNVEQQGDATDELDEMSLNEAIIIARQYLKNAQHDISDALVYFFQQRVDELNSRYGAEAIIERRAKYSDIVDRLRQCRELVIESRTNLSLRDKNYAKIRELTAKLIEEYFELDKTDTFMAIEIAKYQETIKKLKLALIGAGLLLAGCIAYLLI
ncbi:hypothetical protein [Aquicoccus porphyridii]|uniref:hypothetical protein n=1 Tax=Aquicoccus porphyridii TaxID=1852029 RepID=UPI00273E333F|nr:hypothetical protein [Aquicoccus porphyridii]